MPPILLNWVKHHCSLASATAEHTIVIADDGAFLTQMLSYDIRQTGSRLFVARDGNELCSMAARRRADLIVADFQNPAQEGLSACMKLRQNPRTAAIPILLLTGQGQKFTPAELEQTNIRCLVSKPFSVRELMTRIKQLLEHPESPADGIAPPGLI